MIQPSDRKLITEAGIEYIFNIVLESNILKEKLSFKEHVSLCNDVKNLQYEEVVELIFNEGIRAFETKFSKFLKYSLAGIAGLVGGVWGPPLAMFTLYLYRKATDTCVRSCFMKIPFSSARKICKLECQLNAAKKMEKDLRSEISKCSQFQNPKKCERKLQGEHIKWAKRVQLLIVRVNQAKTREEEKLRKQRTSDLTKRAKQLRASLDLSTNQIKTFIVENENVRKNLTFRDHLKLYSIFDNLQEEEQEVQQIKMDPKKEKMLRTVLYLGLWAIPIPFFNDLINYIVKKYSFGCAGKCYSQRKFSKELCYKQCAYLGAKHAVKLLNEQLSKCNKSKDPIKCKKQIYKMLADWKQREVERKIKFESTLRSELATQKARAEKSRQ